MRLNKIFVSFKGGKPFKKKAEGILSEDDFFEINQSNLLSSGYMPNITDNYLRQMEDNYLKIIKSIELGYESTSKENNVIIEYMCQIYKRGRSFRELIEQRLKDNGVSKSEEMAKNITSLSLISERKELQSDFEKRIYGNNYIFRILGADNGSFISSDNPVVNGSESILFPLSSKICLVGILNGSQKYFSLEIINRAIASSGKEYIFGESQELLEKYTNFLNSPDLLALKHLDTNLSSQEILIYL